ncbi:hypothetical protein EYR36_011755 [Pleurotus pulmonarius]|nr:hypothetical protein EYR36_011755 [Pleurotus pulmonarius]
MSGPFARPTPLPSNFEPKAGSLSEKCRSSYARVVCLERRLMSSNPDHRDLPPLRVLGYILLEQLSPEGIEHLARSIQGCADSDDASILQLGRFYAKYFVKIFYRDQGRTPAPSQHPSRSSFDQKRELFSVLLTSSGCLTHGAARQLILERDDHRDLIARDYDEQYMTPEAEEYHAKVNRPTVPLQAAHIIPAYLANTSAEQLSNEQEAEAERWLGSDVLPDAEIHKRSIIWIMLQYFGTEDIYNDLKGDRIHHPSNLLSLSLTDHHRFVHQSLWFEPLKHTPDGYHYKLCVANASARPTSPDHKRAEQVVFRDKTVGTTVIPAPNPKYLALHAACCRIARMSGAALIFDELHNPPRGFAGAVPSPAMFDAVSARLEYGTRGPRVLELLSEPKEIRDIKQFIEIARRKDATQARIKKTQSKTGGKVQTKFKVRCSRYLYTLSVDDPEKADKLAQSLPPGLTVVDLSKATPKKK